MEELYKDGPYEGLPMNHTSETWLAEYFLKKANQLDKKAHNQSKYIDDNFAEELEANESKEWYDILYSELQNKKSYRPKLIIEERNMPALHKALDRFLIANYENQPLHRNGKDSQYLLYWLIKNLTNSDSENLVDYVNRYTAFTLDKTFKNLEEPMLLGEIDGNKFFVLNVEEYENGLETPQLLLFWAEDENNSVVLPYVRYGIEKTPNGKKAYVYAMQRREIGKTDLEERLNRIFAKSNSGIKDYRNATPSMVCVLSAFAGLLSAKGIKEIKAPDYIIRRFGSFWGSENNETDERIQFNATNKFLLNFLRLDQQFEGIDIWANPGDVDSFIHLKLGDEISSKNETLQTFFNMGKSVGCLKEQNTDSWTLPDAFVVPEDREM